MLSLLTTLSLLFVSFVLYYISGVLHRRNSHRRQDGIEVLVERKDAEIDIVAVHGLGAHPEFTWTVVNQQVQPLQAQSSSNADHASNKHRVNWLKDDGFLKEDFKNARIMTFGYNADWFVGAPMATAEQRASTMLRDLKRKRADVEGIRPILFIGHSFGGIVIKHAVCQAETNGDFKDTYNATCGIIFLGTPHQGSNASYPGLLIALLTTPFFRSNAVLLRLLQKHSTELSTLRDKFSQTISRMRGSHTQGLPLIYTFMETKDTFIFNFVSLGRIVDRDSATTDLAKHNIEIDVDHSGLNKCYSRNDRLYQELCTATNGVLEESKTDPYMLNNRVNELMTHFRHVSLSELCAQNVSTADSADKEKWYLMTKEYKTWERADTSEFLWFRGRTRTGKTSQVSKIICESESGLVDKVAYFCPKISSKPTSKPETIVRSMIIQLVRSSQSRVNLLDNKQKSILLSLSKEENSAGTEVLWDLFQSLLRPYSDRKVCLVLDGIDALHSENLTQFAKSLHHIWITAPRSGKSWFKVLITSRPNVQLAEIFKKEKMIDPDTERLECLHSLALGAENPRQNDKNISEPARRTGEWVFTHPRYKAWADCNNSDILLLTGKPGSGKSTLLLKLLKESLRTASAPSLPRMLDNCTDNEASIQNEQGQNQSPSDDRDRQGVNLVEHKIVASYFYNFRNKSEVDNGRMLQSILFQILTQEPRLFPLFRASYLRLKRVGSEPSCFWPLDNLTTIFRSITNYKGFRLRIELFLDAVDESEHSTRVMEFLRQQPNRRAKSDIIIKAIVARRPMEALHDIPSDRIIQLEIHNAIDIGKLVSEGVEKIGEALEKFADIRDFTHKFVEFENKLKDRADGVILWVSVALTTVLNHSVRGGFTVQSMMETLDALPSDLEELYAHIICRLGEQKEEDVEVVKHRLHWTTNAGRALTVSEFFHAIALSQNLHAAYENPFKFEDAVVPHKRLEGVRITLSSSCGGFLEVQPPQPMSELFDSETFLVQLIHRSVRTFLQKKEAGQFRVVKQECNLKITKTCIHYLRISLLCHDNTQDSKVIMQHLGRHSLLAYVWTELPTHLLKLDQNDLIERLQELTSLLQELRDVDLSHPGLLMLHNWTLQLLAQMPSHHAIERWKVKTKSDLTESKTIKIDLQTFFEKILVDAIEVNHFPALRILCGAGALLCDEGDQILSAILETAIKMNNPAILEFIGNCCRKAIDPARSTALEVTFRECLKTGCKNGYEAVTRWLLERGAIAVTEDRGCTAIYLAVNAGHESIVKLLLGYGISPHYKRNNARSLLWIAAEKGYEKLVRVLLQFGVDPNDPDDQDRIPLVVALGAGHEAVVKILWELQPEDLAMSNARPRLQFLVPMERNPNFVGRSDVLHKLEDALRCQMTRIALVGLGGSGKTQTITEFSYRMSEARNVSTVFWMDASSDDSFIRDHWYISRRVQWQLEPKDPSRTKLQQFYDKLSDEFGTKVVIWDNVDHPSDLIRFAGSLITTGSICIIVTSRDAGFSQMFAKDSGCIHLPDLSHSESVDLLKRTIKTDIANDTLRTVADQLGGLPLLISQAGSYMWRHHVSPLQYKSLLDKAGKDLSESTDYSGSLSRTIEISLDHLESEDLPALEILYFMSILDASHIPKDLLLNRSSVLTSRISMEDLDGFIASLLSYSLVHLTQDHTCLDLHRLVQDVIRRRLYRKGSIATWENAALKAVSDKFPRGNFEEWEKCRELLPHALVVLKCDVVKDDENSLHRYELLQNVGTYKMEMGEYPEAEKLLQEAYVVSTKQFGLSSVNSQSITALLAKLFLLMGRVHEAKELEVQAMEISLKALGAEHPATLISMSNLAEALRSQGRYKEAEEMNRRALEGRENKLGVDDPSTLTSISNLALVLQDQGKYEAAEEMNQRALEGRERVLGAEHPDTLTSVNNLALVLQKQGKYEAAERVLKGKERVLGVEHPSTLTSISNLSLVLQGQGKYEAAEEMSRRALKGKERVLGVEHPSTLTSVNTLAFVLWSQGKYEAAMEMYQRALKGREKVLGAEHPDTLTSASSLALVLWSQGMYEAAKKMNRRVLEGREKVLGIEHPDTLTSIYNLASVLQAQGKYEAAERMNQRALEGREKVLGSEHPDTLTSIHNLASVLEALGKYEAAERMNRRVLEAREKVLGVEHPSTLTSVSNLAMVLRAQGKYEAAEEMDRRALEGREKVLGVEHPDTVTSIHNLASVLWSQGKYEAAERMNQQVLERREKVLGAEHPDTLTTVSNLAMVLRAQGKYEAAEEMDRRALEGREKVLGVEHPDTLTSIHNLASVLWSQGKYEAAERMNRQVLERREKVLGIEHPDTLTSIHNLASVLQDLGKYEAAERMNRRALEGREKVLGSEHPDTLTSIHNLASVLEAQRKYEAAEEMNRRALEGREKVLGIEHPDTLTSIHNRAYLLHIRKRYDEASILYLRALEGFSKTLGLDHPSTQTCSQNHLSMIHEMERQAGDVRRSKA